MVELATEREGLVADRRPVEPPDGGAAWRALYEGPAPEWEPVEDVDVPAIASHPLPFATAAER